MNNDALKDFYERDAERFWNPRDGLAGRDLSIYPLMANMSGRVLEYGAGSGSLLLALASEPRFSGLHGVDISRRALNKIDTAWKEMSATSGQPYDKLKLLLPENDRLPGIPDGSVDIVLSLDTIEHVLDPYVVLDEFYRIGAPDSFFIISVPNYGYIKYAAQLMLGRQPVTGGGEPVERWRESGWDGWHLHTFTRQSLDALLRDCGWIPVRWTGYGNKLKWMGMDILRTRFPAMWSGALTVVCRRRK